MVLDADDDDLWTAAVDDGRRFLDDQSGPPALLSQAMQSWAQVIAATFPGDDGITAEPETLGLRFVPDGTRGYPVPNVSLPLNLRVRWTEDQLRPRIVAALDAALPRVWGLDEYGEENSEEEVDEAEDMGDAVEFPFTEYIAVQEEPDEIRLTFLVRDWWPLAYRSLLQIVREELVSQGAVPVRLSS